MLFPAQKKKRNSVWIKASIWSYSCIQTQVGFFLIVLSAGVGRTGTFIGLDSLLKQGRETGKINVFEFVKQMREDRMTMVQTPVKILNTESNRVVWLDGIISFDKHNARVV